MTEREIEQELLDGNFPVYDHIAFKVDSRGRKIVFIICDLGSDSNKIMLFRKRLIQYDIAVSVVSWQVFCQLFANLDDWEETQRPEIDEGGA